MQLLQAFAAGAPHIGDLLADHDRPGVGIPGNHGWHDRGIGDAQPADRVHASGQVYLRLFIFAAQ